MVLSHDTAMYTNNDHTTDTYPRTVRRRDTDEVKEVECNDAKAQYKSSRVRLNGHNHSTSQPNIRQGIQHTNSVSQLSSQYNSSVTVPCSPESISHTYTPYQYNDITALNQGSPSNVQCQSPSNADSEAVQHSASTNNMQQLQHTVSFSTLPALDKCRRYIVTGSLHKSLFGMVKLAFDRVSKHQVAIKISRRDLASHGRSISGAYVLENVRREAAVLRYLCDVDRSSTPYSPNSRMSTDGVAEPVTAASSPSNKSVDGRKYICSVIDELEDDTFHYLVTDYMAAGDLHSLLSCLPNNRLSEYEARKAFKQICYAIKALHSRGVTHLDLSLENICLSPHGHCSVIDFGVAAIHPAVMNSVIQCNNYSITAQTLCASYQLAAGENAADMSRFVCSGRSTGNCKPGKLGYMAPELWSGQIYDVYGCDVWSIGVILYTMTTGRAPFNKPDSSDVWFEKITSGQWLVELQQGKVTQASAIYSHLSVQCLDLIDKILNTQDKRLNIDQILEHTWFQVELK